MTLRMIPTSGHLSKMPTSSTATKIPPPKLLVEVQGNGQFLVEGKSLLSPQLTQLVRSHNPETLAVTIAGGASVNLQELMNAIDAVRSGGATQVGLAAKNVNP